MYIHLGPYCKPAFGCIGYPSNQQINKQINPLNPSDTDWALSLPQTLTGPSDSLRPWLDPLTPSVSYWTLWLPQTLAGPSDSLRP